MKLLVSIVVPVYNVEKYLLRCLESLKSQTYEAVEFIIVDDGSTDKSKYLCDEFVKNEKRARVFHKKNGGLSSARNYGIKQAKGEFICLVDSDDFVKENFVSKMIEVAISKKADVVVCGFNEEVPEEMMMTGEQATIRLLTKQDNMEIIAWNKMYRRDLFDDVKYPDGLNYEDNLTTYKLLSKASRVVYIEEALYEYAERPDSITKKGEKEEKLRFRERAAEEAIDYFSNNKDLKAAAEIAMLTAKLAWVDFAICGKVAEKHLKDGQKWVKNHKEELLANKFLSTKLKVYISLLTNWGGKLYILLRKIRHE